MTPKNRLIFDSKYQEASLAGDRLARGNAKDAGALLGLCLSCEKKDVCLRKNADGGVWRCEEYVECSNLRQNSLDSKGGE